MESKQKKMILAIVLLVLAGVVAAWNFGLFEKSVPKPGEGSSETPRRMPRGPNPDESAPKAPAK